MSDFAGEEKNPGLRRFCQTRACLARREARQRRGGWKLPTSLRKGCVPQGQLCAS